MTRLSLRKRFVVLCGSALLILALIAGAAVAYFSYTDSSNGHPAQAVADSLPTGQTPLTPTTSPNSNSNSVIVTFTQASTVSGVAIPAANYQLKRYPAAGGAGVSVTAACSGTGTISCTESNVPDGKWQYTDTPTYGQNWTGTESGKSLTAIVDTTAPSAAVSYPVDGSTYGGNWNGSISGTASDATSGVASTSVALEDTTTSKWWDGSGFNATIQTFVPASGTTSWSYAIAGSKLTNGDSYSVSSQATDAAGNSGSSSSVSFHYVTTAPSTSVSYPSNNVTYDGDWSGTISGTASSNAGTGTSVASTAVSIEDTNTSKWWDGSGFNSATQIFVAATGTSSWSYGLAASAMITGHSYAVQAKATDSLGNVGTSSTVTFIYNTTHPAVSVTYPATSTTYGSNWTGSITGTATAQAGNATITGTTVAIEDSTAGKWYDGSGFNNSSSTQLNATGTTAWSYSLAAGKLTSGHSYTVVAQATDSAGNVGSTSTVSFSYNTTAPNVAVTYPVNGTTYGANWAGTITGSASSNAGSGTSISSAAVAIENTTTGKWWDGTGFNGTSASYKAASGTASWTFALAAGALTTGDSYSVTAQAVDSGGNAGISSAVSFTYATAAGVTMIGQSAAASGNVNSVKTTNGATDLIAIYCWGGSACGSTGSTPTVTGPFSSISTSTTTNPIQALVFNGNTKSCIEVVQATGNGQTGNVSVSYSGGQADSVGFVDVLELSPGATVKSWSQNPSAQTSSQTASATLSSTTGSEVAVVGLDGNSGNDSISAQAPGMSAISPVTGSSNPESSSTIGAAGGTLGVYYDATAQANAAFGLSPSPVDWGTLGLQIG